MKINENEMELNLNERLGEVRVIKRLGFAKE